MFSRGFCIRQHIDESQPERTIFSWRRRAQFCSPQGTVRRFLESVERWSAAASSR
jgi:hypothetical protein